MTTPDRDAALDARRANARRTAWIVAAIAGAVYVGFILMGVLGK
jgi:hypothetical protein